jgi:hypothetical protein
MSKVSSGKKQYRSMRGKQVDIDLLRKRNELTPAVGNANVNARGDELGPGGTIARKREDLIKEHYAHAGTARSDSAKPAAPVADTVEPVVETKTVARRTTKKAVIEEPITAAEQELVEDDWVQDEDGNFIQKGE